MVPKLTEQSKEDRGEGDGGGDGGGDRAGPWKGSMDPETKHACRQAGANGQGQLPRQGKIDLAFTWV